MSRQLRLQEEALKVATEFYELDHDLSRDQRLNLGHFYSDIWSNNVRLLYLGFIPGLSVPFFWKYYRTGSLRNVNFMASAFTGFTGMLLVPKLFSPMYFESRFRDLKEHTGGDNSKEVQIVKELPIFFAIKWADYYMITADDSSKIFPDPREQVRQQISPDLRARLDQQQQQQEENSENGLDSMLQRDSIGDDKTAAESFEQHKTAHTWEEIRKYGTGNIQQQGGSIGGENEDIFESEFPLGNEKASKTQNFGSSWDRVRKGSISKTGNMIGTPSYSNTVASKQQDKEPITEQEKFEQLLEKERNATD